MQNIFFNIEISFENVLNIYVKFKNKISTENVQKACHNLHIYIS